MTASNLKFSFLIKDLKYDTKMCPICLKIILNCWKRYDSNHLLWILKLKSSDSD